MSTAVKVEPVMVVLRALGLGDFLTGLPALRALEAAFPGHERLLVAPEWLRPLADLVNWRLFPFSLEEDKTLNLDGLACESVQIAVNLHGKGPQSHRAILALEPETFMAFCHSDVPSSFGFPVHRQSEREVQRWCRLLNESGIPANPEKLELPVPAGWSDADRFLLGPALKTASGTTLIHPGAASRSRRWPAQRWAEIARSRTDQGESVLLSGSASERDLCEEIRTASGLPPEANLAGKTALPALVRLVAEARIALSGDTGFAHVATAVGTPSVVLFGPVSPKTWGPPAGRKQHIALWKGRLGDPHANRPDPGLLEIETAEVLAAIERVERVCVTSGRKLS